MFLHLIIPPLCQICAALKALNPKPLVSIFNCIIPIQTLCTYIYIYIHIPCSPCVTPKQSLYFLSSHILFLCPCLAPVFHCWDTIPISWGSGKVPGASRIWASWKIPPDNRRGKRGKSRVDMLTMRNLDPDRRRTRLLSSLAPNRLTSTE